MLTAVSRIARITNILLGFCTTFPLFLLLRLVVVVVVMVVVVVVVVFVVWW